jgi:hypothetical protein
VMKMVWEIWLLLVLSGRSKVGCTLQRKGKNLERT